MADDTDPAIVAGSGLGPGFSKQDYEFAFYSQRSGLSPTKDYAVTSHKIAYWRANIPSTLQHVDDLQRAWTDSGKSYAGLSLTNTVAPAVSGSTTQGSTLTTTNGTWSATPDSYTYQWRRNGTNISGATSSTYATQVADVGTAVDCRVSAIKATYTGASANSNAITVVAAPSNLFSENFPGASGAAWPSQWTTFTAGTGSSAQQAGSNVGRLTSSTTAYTTGAIAYQNTVLATDVDLTFDIAYSAPTTEQYSVIGVRLTTPTATTTVLDGYYIGFYPHNGANALGIFKRVGGGETPLSGDLTLFSAFSAGVYKRLRFRVVGSSIKFWCWDPAGAQPTTGGPAGDGSLYSTTDTSNSGAGRVVFRHDIGNTPTNVSMLLKNILAV